MLAPTEKPPLLEKFSSEEGVFVCTGCVCVCVCVCAPSLVCTVGVIFVYVDTVYGFYGYTFLCLVGCFSMIIWTPIILSVLYACVLYFCICTCSAQLSMFHVERRSRNTLIVIIIIKIEPTTLHQAGQRTQHTTD